MYFTSQYDAQYDAPDDPQGLGIELNAQIRADRVTDPDIRYVTAEEFAAMLAACSKLPAKQCLWWHALLLVCYTAGLRYSEVLHLTWGDVDFDRETVRVAPKADSENTIAWSPKDYQTRTIPIPASTAAILAKLQIPATDGCAYVFLPASRITFIKAAQVKGEWSEARTV
ncbi:MAG TPA: tyrosine-type recombinase/integrase, partial [Phycisphaerae bacterium]|nr:tyrosine-type recombinase/integrase [Phycisphaerae bacterium]